jgi:DNA-binding transcriptional LysR family regulator
MGKIKNWTNMEYFYFAALQGNLIKAARCLGMSSLALNEAIAEFEKELDYPLLIRTPRKLILTLKGEKIFCYARMTALGQENVQNLLMMEESDLPKKITLAVPYGFSNTSLLTTLTHAFQLYPKLQITLVRNDRSFNLQKLNMSPAETQIVLGEPSDPTLHYTYLTSRLYGLYAHPAYLEKQGYPTRREDLRRHILLSSIDHKKRPFSSHADWLLRQDLPEEISPQQIRISFNSIENLYQEAIEGRGIVILPIDSLFLENEELIPVLPHLNSPAEPIYLAYPRKLRDQEEIKTLEKYLVDSYQNPAENK